MTILLGLVTTFHTVVLNWAKDQTNNRNYGDYYGGICCCYGADITKGQVVVLSLLGVLHSKADFFASLLTQHPCKKIVFHYDRSLNRNNVYNHRRLGLRLLNL